MKPPSRHQPSERFARCTASSWSLRIYSSIAPRLKPGCYVVGDLLADLEEALPGERVDLTVLDVCENLRLLHEAVWDVPVVGRPNLVAWLRVTAASTLFDYEISLRKASAEAL